MKSLNNSANRILSAVKALPDFFREKKDLGIHKVGQGHVNATIEDSSLKLSSNKSSQSIYIDHAKNLSPEEMRELLKEVMRSIDDGPFAHEKETAREVAERIKNVQGKHFISSRALYFSDEENTRFIKLKKELETKFGVLTSAIPGGVQFTQSRGEKDSKKFVQAIQAILDFGISPIHICKGLPAAYAGG